MKAILANVANGVGDAVALASSVEPDDVDVAALASVVAASGTHVGSSPHRKSASNHTEFQ